MRVSHASRPPGSRDGCVPQPSQGFCADKSVVIADLQLEDGVSQGAHAFLIDFRVPRGSAAKQLVAGVRLADMGRKTTANDLDNAWCAVAAAPCGLGTPTPPRLPPPPPAPQALPVPASPLRIADDRLLHHPSPPPLRIAFDGVRVPESRLLDRYSYVDAAGRRMVRRQQGQSAAQEHAAAPAAVRGMMMIGQRLFSGRVAVAQVPLHAHTRAHTHACTAILAHARTSMRAHLSWPWRRRCASLLPGDPTCPVCRRRWSSGGISSPSAAATRTPSCAGRPGACARPSRCSRS